ncbi:MAG: hypothetical protein JWM68_4348 [Verrucomicrobiales bacterium]|nr:hypothetical protein [Verrucomicrobiales bacterium]
MRRANTKLLIWLALVLVLVTFVARAYWLRTYGRVVASEEVQIGSVPHQVVLRERCMSDLFKFVILDRILHDRLSEYEYWTELQRNGRLVAVSKRFHWDSTTYDHPRIDSADISGATVSLHSHPQHPVVQRFEWLSQPK